MACTCINRIDGLLAEHNTRLACTFPLVGNSLGMVPTIVTKLIEKKRGAQPMSVVPTFCPFCGTKYRQDADEAAPAATEAEASR